jgi:hypothetical protein
MKPRDAYRRHLAVAMLAIAVVAGAGRSAAQPNAITVDASRSGPVMSGEQTGANLIQIVGVSGAPGYLPLLSGAGVGLMRWPGGAASDYYHWQTNSYSACFPNLTHAATAFDTWMRRIARPLGADVAITINYGTNPSCTGRADPEEAAAWVDYANNIRHYGIKHWTVGNEQYFPLFGLPPGYNPDPVDPAAYAKAVSERFYPMMKRRDPTIQVGIDTAIATFDLLNDPWDPIVLRYAKYDFVEMHYYPQFNNNDNDALLLSTYADKIAASFVAARSLLARHGHPDAPIFLGEFESDAGGTAPGHETVSITDALFVGIVVAEAAKAGVPMAAVWDGIDGCVPEPPPGSAGYGLQHFGSYALFANDNPTPGYSCTALGVPAGTPFPKARAFQVLADFVLAGENQLDATSRTASVRAYAATHRGGYAVLLVNTDAAHTQTPSLSIANGTARRYTGRTLSYGKQQYDQSQQGIWAGPVSSVLGEVGADFTITLPPWSLALVTLCPNSSRC